MIFEEVPVSTLSDGSLILKGNLQIDYGNNIHVVDVSYKIRILFSDFRNFIWIEKNTKHELRSNNDRIYSFRLIESAPREFGDINYGFISVSSRRPIVQVLHLR